MKMLSTVAAQSAPEQATRRRRFRLQVWHVFAGMIVASLLGWAVIFLLIGHASALLHAIRR